jgi:N-acetyltransferase
VKDEVSGRIIGVTSYHDIIPTARRVEIGWTWYAKSFHRTHVNTACKWLMMSHAFEVLNCTVVGWRTDNVNFASQRAIERLGAKKDGVIRSHFVRRDGTIRDTVMYSVTEQEWRYGIKAHLQWLLAREH